MPIKILAIENDTTIAELQTLQLQSGEFEVTTVNSGKEGIDLIRKT